jgi:hypothetical protein
MDTSILSNPAPSNGYNAVLGALAAQAAPAEGTLGGFNASVHNRVKQTFVNPVATYPFLVKPWRNRWELGFHEGDLMFIFHGDDPAGASSKMVVLANLPTLNHIMTKEDEDGKKLWEDYKEKRNWSFIGVMRNSAVASNRIGGGSSRNSSARGGNQRPAERIINIDVRGSSRMFNYWENAMPGQRLHLVWRQVILNRSRMPVIENPNDPAPSFAGEGWQVGHEGGEFKVQYFGPKGVRVGSALNAAEYAALPKLGDGAAYDAATIDERQQKIYPFHNTTWQLLPYSGTESDYTNETIWWNQQFVPSRQMHRPITVGFVFQGIGAGERSDNTVAIRKATQLAEDRFKLPMIHCFVRV